MSSGHTQNHRRFPGGSLFLFACILALAAVTAAEGPSLEVDSPVDGLHTNVDTLRVNGTTEPNITVRVHLDGDLGEVWSNTTSGTDGSIDVNVTLLLGPQDVTVQAEDPMGNTTSVTRRVVLDVTKPELTVDLEHLNGTRIPFNEQLGAYAVRVDEIALSVTYGDDHSDHGNLTVRIDEEPVGNISGPPGEVHRPYPLDEGINTIFVDVTDVAGNRASTHFYVLCDTTPPALVVTAPLNGELTRNATCTVAGTTEPITSVKVLVDSSAGQRAYDLMSAGDGTFSVMAALFSGFQELRVTATDAAGNPTTVTLSIVSDTTPPDFVIDSPKENPTYTNNRECVIVGTLLGEGYAMVYVNGEALDTPGVFTVTILLEEGENPVTVWAVDMAGNEKVVVLTIYLDTVPPGLEVTAPRGDRLDTNDPTVHFEGTVTGAHIVEVEHKRIRHYATLKGGSWEDGQWVCDLELGPFDLEQDVAVRARDRAGNEAIRTVLVVLDVVPPELTLDAPLPPYANQTPILIEGTTSTDAVSLTVNGVPAWLDEGAFAISFGLLEGSNRVEIVATDTAGNVATLDATVHLDTEPPTCDLTYPRGTRKTSVVVKGTCSPDVVRVWVGEHEAEVENGSFEVLVDLPREGINYLVVTLEDVAGNISRETITIERTEDSPWLWLAVALALVCIVLALLVLRRR